MSKTLAEWIEEITAWQDSVFTQATPVSAAIHLTREALEVQQSAKIGAEGVEELASELADVFFLTIGVAHLSGIDLEAAISKKMAINLRRAWGLPDKDGVVEHVRGTLVDVFKDDKLPESFTNLFSGLTREGKDGTL